MGHRLDPMFLAPFRVIDLSPNKLNITAEYVLDTSIVLKRPARECKRYYEDDSSLVQTPRNRFVVEEIVGARGSLEDREYFVKWENYPEEFNTWEPEESFDNREICREADRKFPAELGLVSLSRERDDWMRTLTYDQIDRVIAVRSQRSGPVLELRLKGDRRDKSRRIPVEFIPTEVKQHPGIKALLDSEMM
jgi:hypothetical protein